jgi:pimeloyl-ACP methyl ester carboxylesterase
MKRLAAFGVAASLSLALVSPAISAGRADTKTSSSGARTALRGVDAPIPVLNWRQCRKFKRFECTKARVPLDYDDPAGDTIRLRIARLPASDAAHRIGSLFLNPGGPGGSGVGFVQAIGRSLFTSEVRARFDLVGFDPRGIASSAPIECFDSTQDAIDVLSIAPFVFPVTRAEEKLWVASDRAYAKACARRAGPIIDHMSTANVARDLDLLRQAVGDDRLTFAGYSYGSMIGSTYANMFPDRVRAIIIDGVLDPISWTTGHGNEARTLPVGTRLKSDQGAYDTLLAFFSDCDAGSEHCAFSDGNPKRRYARLARQLRNEPVELPDPQGGTFLVTYADLVGLTLGALYAPPVWPDLAMVLHELDTFVNPPRAAAALRKLRVGLGLQPGDEYEQLLEGFAGVICSDADTPDDAAAWSEAARAADRRNPYFGRPWAWTDSICEPWPGADADRYTGPFDLETSSRVLVIGNRNDPATRYQGAVSTSRILSKARLLTLDGSGHTSLFLSRCIDGHAATYLLTGEVPPRGTVCPVDVVPFSVPARALRSTVEASVVPFLLPPTLTRGV